MQKYESGQNRIGAGRLYLLANFLGAPIDYFFEGFEKDPRTRTETGAPKSIESELALIHKAYLSIPSGEVRQAVLAFIRSLATQGDPVGQSSDRDPVKSS